MWEQKGRFLIARKATLTDDQGMNGEEGIVIFIDKKKGRTNCSAPILLQKKCVVVRVVELWLQREKTIGKQKTQTENRKLIKMEAEDALTSMQYESDEFLTEICRRGIDVVETF